MPPIGTEVKWHSTKSYQQHSRNNKHNEQKDKRMQHMYTLRSTRNLFPKLCNSSQNSEESSAVACSYAFHFPYNHLIASHPISRFPAASFRMLVRHALFLYYLVQYSTLSSNKAVFIHRTVYRTASINLTWHSNECKGRIEFC